MKKATHRNLILFYSFKLPRWAKQGGHHASLCDEVTQRLSCLSYIILVPLEAYPNKKPQRVSVQKRRHRFVFGQSELDRQ